MRVLGLALLLAALVVPAGVAADAATYRFDIHDPDSTLGGDSFVDYYFFLESSPSPTLFDDDGFTLTGTTYGNRPVFGPVAVLDTYTFYVSGFGGGLSTQENEYLGPQLFTGTTQMPTFRIGTFALDAFGTPATLTISDTTAVPEPSAWGMMLTGLGLTGVILRRKKGPASAI